jgi:2'-hydroxyisoflavone reductase
VRLLVLGGTKFLGRAIVEAALRRGDDVTLFNRGTTNPELFPGVAKLRGDRSGDLSSLAGGEWDVVVDPSGFVPHVVRDSAELLRHAVGHYVFVSSISVYAGFADPVDEDSALAPLGDAPADALADDYSNGGAIFRKGVWGGKHGTLFPHYPTITRPTEAASDHAAIYAGSG